MEIQFICELDGFQHGAEPFTIKKIVFQPLFSGPISAFTFNTDFLQDDSDSALATYRYATRYLHGLSIIAPGLPYNLRADVINTFLRSQVYQLLEERRYSHLPTVTVFCKGAGKADLLADLIAATDVLASLDVQNLEHLGCPSANSLIGCRSTTSARAAVFGAWYRGRHQNAITAVNVVN